MKTLFYQGKEIELNYSTTLNHLIPHQLWQCGLSLPALGLAGYLYTLPKQWRLSVTHLSKQLVMSKNTCRKYLKEIFSNEKAREVFKVKEVEINTYDFEEGFTAYDYASDTQELENFTSSVAKDVSEENKKRVLLVQTKEQRYLLNLALNLLPKTTNPTARNVSALACPKPALGAQGGSADQAGECALARNELNSVRAQNLSTIKRDSKESLKDSSKRTREKTKTLEAQKITASFSSSRDGFCDDFTRCADSSAEIRLGCLLHKRESSSRKRAQKTSDLTSEQLRDFNPNEQEAIKLWIRYKQETSKSKLKPSQIDFQLRKITKLKEQGQDICAVIEKSLDMGWQGLFPQRDSAFGLESRISSPRLCDRHPSLISAHDSKSHDSSSKILESQVIGVKPKMPKNIGAKTILCVQ